VQLIMATGIQHRTEQGLNSGQFIGWLREVAGRRLAPQNAILVMGLTYGLIFLVATPPFQVPDEPQYFYRAFHLSELRFFDMVYINTEERAKNGRVLYGALLPKSLASIVDSSDVIATRFRPTSKIIGSLKIVLNPNEREYLPIAPYPPIAYTPQAIGIALGRSVGLSPLGLFYLARLSALIAWLTMMYMAIKNTPVLKWAFFLLGMMPMTLHLAASNSGDSTIIGLSFLMSATLLKWAYDTRKNSVERLDIVCLAAMAIGIALSKAVYLPLLFLFLVVPHQKFPSRRKYYLILVIIFGAAVAANYVWNSIVVRTTLPGPTISLSRHGVDITPSSNVSPHKQIEFLQSHPLAFVSAVGNTMSRLPFYLFSSFVGVLGWLDTWLPLWVPCGYLIGLIVASRLSSSTEHITFAAKLVAAAIFCAAALASLLYIYIVWDSVGADYVGGFQGRYLIPVAPALLLVFHRNKAQTYVSRRAAIAFILFVGLSSLATTYRIIYRFYGTDVRTVLDERTIQTKRE
jgi:uncharacterized membrane protein